MSKLIWPDKDDDTKKVSSNLRSEQFDLSDEMSDEEGFSKLVKEIHRRERKKLYTKRMIYAIVVITIWVLIYFFA